jgi:hypothetical protein
MERDREQRIRERAYQIWEREGKPQGRDAQHWQQAAAEVEAEAAVSVGMADADPPPEEPQPPPGPPPPPMRRSRPVSRREPAEKRRS